MTLYGRDANGNDAYIRGTGAGTTTDGHVTFHDVFSDEIKFTAADLTASADLVNAVASKKLRVTSFSLSSDADCSVKFQSELTDDISGTFYLNNNTSITQASELGLFQTDEGDRLNLVVTENTFPIGAVDPTNDTLVIVTHGLRQRTPVKVVTTGTLPGGLSSSTVYFVVRDNNDTIKLAATAAEASQSPPVVVDITDAGTGTHSLALAVNVGVTLSYRQV